MFGFEQGTVIGGSYRVVGALGRGGMGVVLRARDERLERDVAIKLIRPELLNEELRERFLHEARAMARVSHPNVLPIYAFGEHEGAPYFVTQLVHGKTVDDWLERRPPGMAPDLESALEILEQTCRGVAAIHAAETVHRDLKPSNLLLEGEDDVRVADMGVAALVWGEAGADRYNIVGTPEYMAPEIVLQDTVPELAHRADVYALGCLAFELLTGATPFPGKTALARMTAHVNDPAPPPSARRRDLSPELDDVVLSALVKDPRCRTPSADALRRGLIAARAKTRDPVRILLADDDDDFRETFASTLRHEFPDTLVDCVADGQAALEAFDTGHHSVAIVDLRMPRMGGMALTELLRARRAARSVPIVVLTGMGGPAEWKHLSELGADGFLVKPVNVKDVATVLRRVLAERRRNVLLEDSSVESIE
ncbi:MAG: protein kinase domain-containing protein, partial [Polyangiaceae bacterium]